MCSCLPNIRGHVCHGLLYGYHHDWYNDGHTDTGENTEGTGPDQLVGILESFLEGADGEKSDVLLLLCIPHQVDIDKLLDLEREGGSPFHTKC